MIRHSVLAINEHGKVPTTTSRLMIWLFEVCVLASCLSCGGGTTVLGEEPADVIVGIGSLPSDVSSEATSISKDGLVVAGLSKSASGKSQAFRWTRVDGIKPLGYLAGGTSSTANAVSADGSVIVGSGNSFGSSTTAYRWSVDKGMVPLNGLNGSTTCAASGVSGDGDVVVGTCLIAGNAGFRWTEASGMVALGQFGGGSNQSSNALAISTDGRTIVGVGHPVLTGAVVWDAVAGVSILGSLAGDVSAAANAVSRDGRVVVGYSTQPSLQQRAFRWSRQEQMTELGTTGARLTELMASAVSGDGRVVVGWGRIEGAEVAVIWDDLHGVRIFDNLVNPQQVQNFGWRLLRATGISDDGRTVVGYGINPDGKTEGWVIVIANR